LPNGLGITLEVAAAAPHKVINMWTLPDTPPAETRVDIGGRSLAYTGRGVGTPTVILEAGLGWAGDAWAWVIDAIAQDPRVISYR
jgi:hypothetical protein